MRVIFFVPYPIEGASNRYRINQYIPYLEKNGVVCDVRPLFSSEFYKILYKRGRWVKKALQFLRCTLSRLRDVRRAKMADVIFVHRECFPFGPPIIEWLLRRMGKPMIYDFDDAIYLPSEKEKWLKTLLKNPGKVPTIIRMCDRVIVCNEHLKQYCTPFNKRVTIIPTSVDTDVFSMKEEETAAKRDTDAPVHIGWIGSHSTAKYLHRISRALERVAKNHPLRLTVIGAGETIFVPEISVLNKPWSLSSEVQEFKSFDIGIYPLDDDPWVLGKTGFKTIQYMAVGVPAVVSRAGTNNHIVKDGVNGLLAGSEDEWVRKLEMLITDQRLRETLAKEGRKTAVTGYSVQANAPALLTVIKNVFEESRRVTQ